MCLSKFPLRYCGWGIKWYIKNSIRHFILHDSFHINVCWSLLLIMCSILVCTSSSCFHIARWLEMYTTRKKRHAQIAVRFLAVINAVSMTAGNTSSTFFCHETETVSNICKILSYKNHGYVQMCISAGWGLKHIM